PTILKSPTPENQHAGSAESARLRDRPGRREAAGGTLARRCLCAASHVLPNAIFWEANPSQVFDFSGAPGHKTSQPPKADVGMSALCQKRTHAVQQKSLFDHLIRARKERRRYCETERLRGLEIDGQLIPGRRLNRKVGGLLTFEDAIDVFGR